ncbi:hypothetical protein J116_009700 [Streptomyces thermolilacinus SPC6]|uniref:Uncharacterized protein n=1 Tax=Streptomyces thermolilacinus SPC6 TaxID=1306406 RepID=A0A1D3DQV2_9ACTN|nr:hypothetical protein J116_009700 [Streptomyces thermolilacinus SPC6]
MPFAISTFPPGDAEAAGLSSPPSDEDGDADASEADGEAADGDGAADDGDASAPGDDGDDGEDGEDGADDAAPAGDASAPAAPTAWAEQPVARAIAAAASTPLRMAVKRRCMAAPRESIVCRQGYFPAARGCPTPG